MASPSQTTIIFVPGGWHSPECFEQVGNLLIKAGYKTDYVHLPSVGPQKPLSSLEEDTAQIRKHILLAVNSGQDVIMITHSYGGVPTQDAVKGLDKASRSQQQQAGGVRHLFFCCSFIIDQGFSVMSAFGSEQPSWYKASEDETVLTVITPEETFYNDLDPAEAKIAAAKLKPHSNETAKGIVQYAAWRHVPSSYLYCLKDQALPYELQKMMVEQTAGGAGIKFQTYTLDASHSPFLSMPQETSEAIRKAAGESI